MKVRHELSLTTAELVVTVIALDRYVAASKGPTVIAENVRLILEKELTAVEWPSEVDPAMLLGDLA